jgi:energy-coupling factor transport system ATP-binding protein
MNNGEILLDGTPAEVFREHALIRSVNLELPMSVELAVELRRRGIKVPEDVVTIDDMVEFVTSGCSRGISGNKALSPAEK